MPPADHLTKKLILNPVEGSRSAPTRIANKHQSTMGWHWRQCPWKRFPYTQVSDVLCYKLTPITLLHIFLYSCINISNRLHYYDNPHSHNINSIMDDVYTNDLAQATNMFPPCNQRRHASPSHQWKQRCYMQFQPIQT